MKKILILILSLFIITSCWNNDNHKDISKQWDLQNEVINNKIKETFNVSSKKSESKEVLKEQNTDSADNENIVPILDRINNWPIDKKFCSSLEDNKNKFKCNLELKAREKRKIAFETNEKARNDLDIKVCNSLIEDEQKNNCISWVIETKINLEIKDKSFCDEIPKWNIQLEQLINRCISKYYYTQAKEKQDIKICEKVTDQLQKWSCLNEIFNKDKENITDTKYCDIFTDNINKNNCIYQINKNLTKNTMVIKSCDRFIDNIQKNTCKREVILRNAEEWIDKCDFATDDMLKNECIQKLHFIKWVKEKTLKYCIIDNWDDLSKNSCEQSIIKELNMKEKTDKYCELFKDSKLNVEQCKYDFKFWETTQ